VNGRSGFALFFGWTVTQLGFQRSTLERGDVMNQLEFRLLGPFEVSSGRRMILSGGGKRRAILAVLLLSANEAVSVERLIDAL
jgi:hypothetical protein